MFKLGVIIMALSASLFGNWFTDLFDSTPTPTIKIPVDLTKAGVIVDMEFRVDYDESTRFSLDFECKDVKLDGGLDCNKVQKFVGFNGYLYGDGKKITIANYARAKRMLGDNIDNTYDLDGTMIALRISLTQLSQDGTQKNIIDKVFETKGQNGGTIYRDITVKYLEKDKYKLTIENLISFKELENRHIDFKIQSTYKK